MQWHKAKVSIFLQKWSKFRTKIVHTKNILKMEGEILKLKKWGEDEETTLCTKFKSLKLKRSDQMGAIQ